MADPFTIDTQAGASASAFNPLFQSPVVDAAADALVRAAASVGNADVIPTIPPLRTYDPNPVRPWFGGRDRRFAPPTGQTQEQQQQIAAALAAGEAVAVGGASAAPTAPHVLPMWAADP